MSFFKEIINKKFVDYFSTVDESSINSEIMNEFLNKMVEASEGLEQGSSASPTDIIKEIKSRLGLDGGAYSVVTQVASSDLINSISSLEAFTLLWFVSCKNTFCFEEGVYYNMARNKTIGNLLKRLSNLG